jgi:hypothetical protein
MMPWRRRHYHARRRDAVLDPAGRRFLAAGVGVVLLVAWVMALFLLLASGERGWAHLWWYGTPVLLLGLALCSIAARSGISATARRDRWRAR